MRHILGALLLAAGISSAGAAQVEKVEKLPPHPDVISVAIPEGYKYAHGKGMFGRFIYEYVPADQSVDNWESIISLSALGMVAGPEKLEGLAKTFLKGLGAYCSSSVVRPAGRGETPSVSYRDYQVYCETTDASRETLSYLRPVEIGYYRFMVSDSATYEFHYAWHGSHAEAAKVYGANEDAFWDDARSKAVMATVCDVRKTGACSFDYDMLEKDVVKATGDTLRCRAEAAPPCSPAAILTLRPATGMTPDPQMKKGLSVIPMNTMDITDARLATALMATVKTAFEKGTPAYTLVFRPTNDPNHVVTEEERTRTATLFTLLGEILVQQNIAEGYGIMFMNFQ